MSTWSAISASQLPSPEPNVARKSSRKRRLPSSAAAPWKRPELTARTLREASEPPRRSGAREHALERRAAEGVLLPRANRDPQRRRGAEAGQRPDDQTLAQQLLVERHGVRADLDVEEVAD